MTIIRYGKNMMTRHRAVRQLRWTGFYSMWWLIRWSPDTLRLKITLTMNMKVGLSVDLKWRVQKARQSWFWEQLCVCALVYLCVVCTCAFVRRRASFQDHLSAPGSPRLLPGLLLRQVWSSHWKYCMDNSCWILLYRSHWKGRDMHCVTCMRFVRGKQKR